jgi:hypothetical protein
MKLTLKLIFLAAALSVGLAIVGPATGEAGSRQPMAQAKSTPAWAAEIIPAAQVAVGNALSGGDGGVSDGYALSANGINNYDTTCTGKCYYHFVFLTFTNAAVTASLQFKIVGPAGATVYSYTFPSEKISVGTDWFTISAEGNFSLPGTYEASVYGISTTTTLLGSIPLLFASK